MNSFEKVQKITFPDDFVSIEKINTVDRKNSQNSHENKEFTLNLNLGPNRFIKTNHGPTNTAVTETRGEIRRPVRDESNHNEPEPEDSTLTAELV